MSTHQQRLSLLLLLFCFIIAIYPVERVFTLPLADMLTITLSVYALARGLNAVISVAQGTEMSIEPMGVGLTLAPGEILDPLNDLIEQFSMVLLMASASLGMQQIILLISDVAAIRLSLAVLVVIAMVTVLMPNRMPSLRNNLLRTVIFLTLLRLLVPIVSVISHQTQNWLASEREQAISVLEATQEDVDGMNAIKQENPGWLSDLRQRLDIETRLTQVRSRAEQAVEAAVYLLAEFILLMLVLPILAVWVFVRLMARVLR